MVFKPPHFFKKILKATSFWKTNFWIIREFKYFRRIVVLALVFTVLAAASEGLGIGFFLTFLQSLIHPESTPIRTGIDWFDISILGVNAPINERIYRVSGLIIIITLLRLIFIYLEKVYTSLAGSRLVHQLRIRLFEQLQSLNLSYFTKTRSGELINSLTTEPWQLLQAFEMVSLMIIRASTVLAYLLAMVLLSWQLTVISVMLFSLLSVGISNLLKRVREISFEKTRASGHYTSVALELISGIRTVQAFAAQNFERQRFYKASSHLLDTEDRSRKLQALIEPLTEGMATAILVGMLLFAFARLIPSGQMQAASLLTFLFVLFRLMPLIRQLNGLRSKLNNFQGSIANIKELLRTDNKPYLTNGTIEFTGLKNGIEFRAVDFGYDSNNLILHNISLTFKQGQMTALVGASGAGKTTLADLIPRFYDPTQGIIAIDGIDLREFEISSLRQKIAVVSQDTFIFNTSVRDNIAYALEGVEESAILEAAQLANALEFVQELPEGFDTRLGDRGVRLSGGQRQRIAIARALLRNPDILILDEATSALDSVSERLIQESLEKLSIGRTVIAIAHRLSTIAGADKVVVLEQGKVVEQGKYQELLEQRGKLWNYHQMQYELGQTN
ncbi:MAG TPA: ABC transporter ATP-binding protein [Cyanobacteria bacterium UBA11162]|nr:ABC transporter ATP-binding protein [Cyanobacteria bacterium UBA11162]